jgi:hypothetical protein
MEELPETLKAEIEAILARVLVGAKPTPHGMPTQRRILARTRFP